MVQPTVSHRYAVFVLAALLLLSGCSSGPVRTQTQAADLERYRNVMIADVDVWSNESDPDIEKDNRDVEQFARQELQRIVEQSRYRYLSSRPVATSDGADAPVAVDAAVEDSGATLAVTLDMNIDWGSRALRYFVGFGAGKGTIQSTLTVKDAGSGVVKYQSSKESTLSMGVFGGSMESVVHDNIAGLLEEFPGRSQAQDSLAQNI